MAAVKIPVTPGEIQEHGYSIYMSAEARRRALREAVEEEGHARPVYRHLIARATQLKRTSPTAAKTLRRDAEWVKETFYGTKWWPRPRK
ncbi:MAG: hypothetical protein QW580_01900 [Nitrososphaerota archaeon]